MVELPYLGNEIAMDIIYQYNKVTLMIFKIV